MNRFIRTLLGVTAAVGVLALGTPALATSTAGARPFLFDYSFNGHLMVAGGNFTVGNRVYVAVKFTTGQTAFFKWVTARPHSVTPGGAVYVETTIAAPCSGSKNGYAVAYDNTTKTWSPRLPVTICRRID